MFTPLVDGRGHFFYVFVSTNAYAKTCNGSDKDTSSCHRNEDTNFRHRNEEVDLLVIQLGWGNRHCRPA